MKSELLFNIILSILLVSIMACKKDDPQDLTPAIGDVELYLIDTFKTVNSNSHQIDESTVELKEIPLLNYSDFISYNSSTYAFEITDEAIRKIKELKYSGYRQAFAIVANNEMVYTGYFWAMTSSLSCNWIVTLTDMLVLKNELRVELGYPGPSPNFNIPDKRNDQRILNIFKRDGKLNK